MRTRIIKSALILAVLAGCASKPQQPISLAKENLPSPPNRIGVMMPKLPALDTHLVGASCLLCYAAASVANSSLTKHTRTLPYENIPKLKDDVAEVLQKKGTEVMVIPEQVEIEKLPPSKKKVDNSPPKDFSVFATKYKIDKLLVFEITAMGMWRTYSAYLPTSDPKGVFKAVGYLVNLSSGAYEWYLPVEIMKSAEGAWDEPPSFPGLTNAYYQALELGRDALIKPFIE
jgi:hypothetical protein